MVLEARLLPAPEVIKSETVVLPRYNNIDLDFKQLRALREIEHVFNGVDRPMFQDILINLRADIERLTFATSGRPGIPPQERML